MNSTAPRRGLFAALLAGISGVLAGRTSARPVPRPSSANPLREQLFQPLAAGTVGQLLRDPGHSPRAFGMSTECAKQRRKNKLRRAGIGGDRQ